MQIRLSISKPLLQEYFQYLFPTDESGTYQVTRKSDLGKAICCFVRYAHRRIPHRDGALLLQLPEAHTLMNAPRHHLYFCAEDEKRINDLLQVYFNLDFDRYYLQGKKNGFKQKDIIESFIVSRRLHNLMSDNETLKKRKYREELRLLEQRHKSLVKRAYWRNEKIEASMQENTLN